MAELHDRTADWLFVDMGFSRDRKSCGYLFVPASTGASEGGAQAEAVTFGVLTQKLVALAAQDGVPIHLVLEAPLSAAFGSDGNPLGRVCEKQDAKTRYWYAGLGCSVLVASLYLLRSLVASAPQREVRIFEGLVSFKSDTMPTDHVADVKDLMQVVWSGGTVGGRFRLPEALESGGDAVIESILALLGLDPTPPPIVEVHPA
jgi:hypothetical protein